MPRVIVTVGAARGLSRYRRFLAENNPAAAARAGQTIARHFWMLETAPAMGRPMAEQSELRELVIGFGESGYVALYHCDPDADAVYVLAFRHQKQVGY